MRDQVYMRLRTQGSLESVKKNQYFLDEANEDKLHYCMSAKALFYFMLKCSPQIEKEMMSKYLENPLNPMMFVEYDQSCENFIH